MVRPAEAADLHFVIATERLPGYEHLVGRSTPAQHEAYLADDRHAYFIAEAAGSPAGFVIVRDWNSWDGVSLMKRVAVAEPGRGIGRAMLSAVVDRVFLQTEAWRLEIGLFPANERARRCYEASGFVPEGIARGRVFFEGEHRDEMVMAMLRPEWEARRG
ncbi:GNAT family N-acetyltransferase [Kaistia algarum]|nr:GNAT family N-acetyltransferase [Kaistia algarum]